MVIEEYDPFFIDHLEETYICITSTSSSSPYAGVLSQRFGRDKSDSPHAGKKRNVRDKYV